MVPYRRSISVSSSPCLRLAVVPVKLAILLEIGTIVSGANPWLRIRSQATKHVMILVRLAISRSLRDLREYTIAFVYWSSITKLLAEMSLSMLFSIWILRTLIPLSRFYTFCPELRFTSDRSRRLLKYLMLIHESTLILERVLHLHQMNLSGKERSWWTHLIHRNRTLRENCWARILETVKLLRWGLHHFTDSATLELLRGRTRLRNLVPSTERFLRYTCILLEWTMNMRYQIKLKPVPRNIDFLGARHVLQMDVHKLHVTKTQH